MIDVRTSKTSKSYRFIPGVYTCVIAEKLINSNSIKVFLLAVNQAAKFLVKPEEK